MKNGLHVWYRRILAWWRGGDQREQHWTEAQRQAEKEHALPVPAQSRPAAKAKTEARQDEEDWHLRDLLDQLPLCHRMTRKLRSVDPHSYNYYRTVGAKIGPRERKCARALPVAAEDLPGKGIIWFPPDDTVCRKCGERHSAAFVAFQKLETSVWKGHGTVYSATVIFSWHDKNVIGTDYHVVVRDQHALAVPMPTRKIQKVWHRDRDARRTGGHVSNVHTWHLGLPEDLWRMYKTDAHGDPITRSETIHEYGGRLLADALAIWLDDTEEQRFTVRASKNGVAVRFDVALQHPKRFFRDRELEAASDGRRKRIIHWVAPHDRVLADGRTTTVKGHFRGAERFLWNGFNVLVTMPDNIADARRFTIPAVPEEELEDGIPVNQIGPLVARLEAKHGSRAAWSSRH